MWSRLRDKSPFGSRDLSCQKFSQMASEFLDGALNSRMLWEFSYHSERCRGCSAFVSTLRATVGIIRALPTLEAPEELKQRIREQCSRGGSDTGS